MAFWNRKKKRNKRDDYDRGVVSLTRKYDPVTHGPEFAVQQAFLTGSQFVWTADNGVVSGSVSVTVPELNCEPTQTQVDYPSDNVSVCESPSSYEAPSYSSSPSYESSSYDSGS